MEVPLVVFVNTKAGGLQGPRIMEKFKKCTAPENVFDLAADGPLPGLQKYRGQRYRIIVCGGDGSVGWVLNEIDKLKLPQETTPSVAVLPIGTGNDLSRVLRWGGSHKGTKLKSFVSKIEKACVVLLDKWDVRYSGDVPMPHTNHSMHNYFSIGADASISLQFHDMRTAHPEKFASRKQNLSWYMRLGLQNFSAELLPSYVSVEIDGKKARMPDNTRCVVVLNVPSYSGGGNPWGTKHTKTYLSPAIDDGLLEVVAVNGPLQLVGIHANVIRGQRLGQGSNIKITTTKQIPAQVDGEPWNQPPSVINISFAGKARVLANSPPTPTAPVTEQSALPATTLLRQPSVAQITRTMSRSLMRTRSSSMPMEHTPSPIKYGPVVPAKRKKGRLYCEGCGLEFYLPYMLLNHKNGGTCVNGSSASDSSSKLASTPPHTTLSVQIGDGVTTTDATSHCDSDDEGNEGIWRAHSSDVASRAPQVEEQVEVPWSSGANQTSPASSPPTPSPLNPSPHILPTHNDTLPTENHSLNETQVICAEQELTHDNQVSEAAHEEPACAPESPCEARESPCESPREPLSQASSSEQLEDSSERLLPEEAPAE